MSLTSLAWAEKSEGKTMQASEQNYYYIIVGVYVVCILRF